MKGNTVITLLVFKAPPGVLLFLYSSGILEKVPDLFKPFCCCCHQTLAEELGSRWQQLLAMCGQTGL